MSRDDLLSTNAEIVSVVAEQVAKRSPNAILIVVIEPARRDVPRGVEASRASRASA